MMGRLKQLDGLRGIAVAAVVLFHFIHQYPRLFQLAPVPGDRILALGGYGVDLFFIISGFVILLTLERTATFGAFLKARAARLYPTYWVGVLLTFLCTTVAGVAALKVGAWDFLANFTMLQGLLGFASVDGAYWSLQAEWGFYLSASLLFFSGCLRRPLLGIAGWLAFAVFVQAVPWGGGPIGGAANLLNSLLALRFVHLFLMGAAFFLAWRERKFGAAHVAIVAAALARQTYNEGWIVGLLTSSYALAFVFVAKDRLQILATNRPALFLGRISYSLYLVHQNIGYLVIGGLLAKGLPFGVAVVGAIVVTLGLATLLNRLVEEPVVRTYQQRRSVVRRLVVAGADV